MIKILHRYIVKTIFQATLLITLVFTGVMCLLTLLAELKNIGEGDYGLLEAMLYVFLRLPNQLYQISPMLILLGSVVGLSVMASYRELSVMRTSGYSIRQILYGVLSAALLFVAGITIIGEWAAPEMSYNAEIRKENAQNAGQAVITASGVWFHVENNFIHVNHVVDRQLLEGVTRYQFDANRHLLVAYYAKTLSYENNQWVMKDVVKTTFSNNRTRSEVIPLADWNLKFNTNLLNVGLVDPNEMTLSKLAKFSRYLDSNGLQSSAYKYEFWQRVFKPLAALLMIFLAVPFVLGAFRTSTLGWRLFAGILVGFAFFILNALLGQVCIVYQLPAVLAASLPLFLFALVGLYLSRQLIKQ
jgi:lipopolysaccharide export system permease protein